MSTLSSGRGIIWASKGGGGRRESICSGVLLLDKTDVRREETQKNTVQQDALLKGTQRGTWGTLERDTEVKYGLWRKEHRPVCMSAHLEGGCEADMKRMRSATCSHPTKRSTSRCLKAPDTQDSSAPESSPGFSHHPKPMVEPWPPLHFYCC